MAIALDLRLEDMLFRLVMVGVGLARSAAFALALTTLGIAFGALPGTARAADQGLMLKLKGFTHTAWTRSNGAPTQINDLAQTTNGILYLAAADGVYRFDGVNFDLVPAPGGSAFERARPTMLLAAKSGDLWIGYSQGAGVALLHRGRISDLAMPKPPTTVSQMAQTRDGALWIGFGGGDRRLSRYLNGQWLDAEQAFKLPPGQTESLAPARDGSLWISVLPDYIVRLAPGGNRFVTVAARAKRSTLAFDPAGRLWAFGHETFGTVMGARGQPTPPGLSFPAIPKLRHVDPVFDPWGGIWGSTRSAGIFRIALARTGSPGPAELERFGRANGLTADTTNHMLVDREGNIWVATNHGLDRFRRAGIVNETSIPTPDQNGLAIAQDTNGAVYLVSTGKVFEAAPGAEPRLIRSGLGDTSVICPARQGGMWVGADLRMLRIDAKSTRSLAVPKEGIDQQMCAEDGVGRLWLVIDTGVLWHDAAGWHHLTDLPEPADIWDLEIGPEGDPWFTANRQILLHLTPHGMVRIGPEKLKVGVIAGIVRSGGDMLVWGFDGLVRLRGDRIERFDLKANPWLSKVRSILDAGNGSVWFTSRDGIASASAASFERGFGVPGFALPRRTFDALNGTETFMQAVGYRSTQIAAGPDGRTWFLTTDGVSYVNTGALPFNALPPPVYIQKIATRDAALRDPADPVFAAGTRAIDITYSAYSLTMPERVQFRYRLEGVDQGWIDPGLRRTASYTNLSPGAYSFRVIAANNDGVWNRQGATLHFRILPTFFESWPFLLLCGLIFIGLCWIGYSLRIRAVASKVSLRLTERMNERERIARELHDTLLQGINGLMLRFQAAIETLPKASRTRDALENALDAADAVVLEGRDRIRDLRLFDADVGLEQAIARLPSRYALAPRTQCVFVREGTSRPLVPIVATEIVNVVNEALYNVTQHAQAAHVTIRVEYRSSGVVVSVSDDGIGIDEAVVRAGSRPGHYGLPGMFERAARICARLDIARLSPGTRVMLTVPAAGIFVARARNRSLAGLWRWIRRRPTE